MQVEIGDAAQINKYLFGTSTAEFHICRACGVVPVVTSEISGHIYAVVNVNTFTNVDDLHFKESVTDFDGESTESRLDRRARVWIPRVTIVERGM